MRDSRNNGEHECDGAGTSDDTYEARDSLKNEEAAAPQETESASAGRQMTLAALVISAFLFVGKFAGYVRDMVISGYFGDSAKTDAFYLIYNNIIFMVYTKIEKLLRPTFLPQFVKLLKTDEKAAWKLASVVTNAQFLSLLLIVAILELFPGVIIRTLWPNLASDAENLATAVVLLRVMAPSLLLFSTSVMPELILHSYKKFTVPAFADCGFRIATVVTLVVSVEYLWHPDHPNAIGAAALGVLIGGPLRFFMQLPKLWQKAKNYILSLDFSASGVKTVFALMPPVIVGLVFSIARGYADSRFADSVGEGVYTCLTFARKMADAPLQIVPLAVSFVVYPYLSQWAAENAKDKLADSLVSMTRVMAFIFVPATVAIMLLSNVIISVMFEHGEFGAESTRLAAIALFCYALGIMAFSVEGSINKWYFALEDTRTPNYVGAACAILHIVIGYVGVRFVMQSAGANGVVDAATLGLGIGAIAMALTVSKTVKVVVLYALITRRIGHIDRAAVLGFIAKLAFSTAVMGVAIWAVLAMFQEPLLEWEPPVGGKKVQMIALFAVTGSVGFIAYVMAAAGTRMEEFTLVWKNTGAKVLKRFGRR